MNKYSFLLLFFILYSLFGCSEKKRESTTLPLAKLYVRGVGKVIPEGEILKLSLDQDGIVEKIFISENDTVAQGNAILKISDITQLQQLRITEAQINTQQKIIDTQRSALKEELFKLDNKKTEYERILRLYLDSAETGQAKDNSLTNLNVQNVIVERFSSQLESERNKLDELLSTKQLNETEISKRSLFAPKKGIILELPIKEGEYIKSGDIAAQLYPIGNTIVISEIDELFAPSVKVGQEAFLISTGSLDTLGRGKIIFTSKFLKKKSLFYEEAGESEDRRVMEIKILPDSDLNLLLNSKIECSVNTGETI